MQNFFNPNEQADILIPMYGWIHLIVFLVVFTLIPIMVWRKKEVKKLCANRRFMVRFMLSFMAVDLLYWVLVWSFSYEPMYERFPFHLCATMALLLPILILSKSYNGIRFFTFWAVAAGFISFVNPGFIHDDPFSFAFIHYLIRHYFIFLLPVFIFIGTGYSLRYRNFIKSSAWLLLYACFIFLVNWATGANYLHLGRNNPLAIPFLPDNLSVWPWTLPSFIVVGFVLLHFFYFVFTRIDHIIKT